MSNNKVLTTHVVLEISQDGASSLGTHEVGHVGARSRLPSFVRMLVRLGRNRIHSPSHFFTPLLRRTPTTIPPRFIPSRLDEIEDIEDYHPGGYHPISIGDTFDHGRFRVLHKLGFGGYSTVWLARDQWEGGGRRRIVTLKAMRADVFSS